MKKLMCGIIFILLLISPCAAEEYSRRLDALGMDELYAALPADASEIELEPDVELNEGLRGIWDNLGGKIGAVFSEGVRCVLRIVAVSMLCATAGAIGVTGETRAKSLAVSLVGAVAVCAAAAGSITSVIGMGRGVISEIEVFSKALLPSVAAAEAACGVPTSAVVKASAAVLFSDVLITLVKNVFLPLVYVNLFTATAYAAVKNDVLRRISDISVKIVSSSLKIILGAYISYITVAGLISGGVDRAGVKAAQLAAGSVPVVGGIMSGATETVLAGAAVIKNAVGVFGFLAILAAVSVPVMTLAINYMTFKVAAVFATPMMGGGLSEQCDRIGQSFGLVLAMVCSCALVMFIAIIAAIKSVGVA